MAVGIVQRRGDKIVSLAWMSPLALRWFLSGRVHQPIVWFRPERMRLAQRMSYVCMDSRRSWSWMSCVDDLGDEAGLPAGEHAAALGVDSG